MQADCPEDVPAYIHRVGRTARYMSSGKGLLLLVPSEKEGMLAQVGGGGACQRAWRGVGRSGLPPPGVSAGPAHVQRTAPLVPGLSSPPDTPLPPSPRPTLAPPTRSWRRPRFP